MMTKLRPDGSVRGKPVKRTGEECVKERKRHLSQFRGERTINNSEVGNWKRAGSLGWREPWRKRWVRLKSAQHKEAHPEENEEPAEGVSIKVWDPTHASKRSPGRLCSKYFQEPHCLHSQKEAEMLYCLSSNSSPKVLPGELNTVHGIPPSTSAF